MVRMILVRMIRAQMVLTRVMLAQMIAVCVILAGMMPARRSIMRGICLAPRLFVWGGRLQG
jgi:hypothetical protein